MDIYKEQFIESLFNRMSKTYGTVNYLSSFGFSERWRRQCVQAIKWDEVIQNGFDLMSGMGESWNLINSTCTQAHKLTGVDISTEMNNKASQKQSWYPLLNISVKQANVLHNDLESESADYIVSCFGLKTFSPQQLEQLAGQVNRLLKPNGQFSFIEVAEPKLLLLKIPFMFYLKYLIPIIGKLFMGHSEDYKMLGVYCQNFKDCSIFKAFLEKEGLEVRQKSYFFGCASGVIGRKKV
jgi:ubiquinone/menaquinone biosynthesis C-methylase UbiE